MRRIFVIIALLFMCYFVSGSNIGMLLEIANSKESINNVLVKHGFKVRVYNHEIKEIYKRGNEKIIVRYDYCGKLESIVYYPCNTVLLVENDIKAYGFSFRNINDGFYVKNCKDSIYYLSKSKNSNNIILFKRV